MERVGELEAATSLIDIQYNPSARLHRLKELRSDEYYIDLVHHFRLIIKYIPYGIENINKLENINIVRIEEVIDYHGKQKK
jgi:proteic killer suppression protein